MGSSHGEELSGVVLASVGVCEARQHPRQLANPLPLVQGAGRGGGAVPLHDDVGVGVGGHLREVADAQSLAVPGEPGQLGAHRQGGRTSDTGVDLVEGHQPGVTGP